MAQRLKTIGRKIYLPDGVTEYIPRHFCWNATTLAGDGALAKSLGANGCRITPAYYNATSPPYGAAGSNDLYNPNVPNYLDPLQLSGFQAQISEALSVGGNTFWTMIGLSGCNGDFFTNPAIIPQFIASWVAIANLYKNVDYIACYEILIEPQISGVHFNSIDLNAIISAMHAQVIAAIRAVDPYTPIAIGAGANYDLRNLEYVYSSSYTNVWYFSNWYEIGSGPLGGYVKQTKNGINDLNYPGYYFDYKGAKPANSFATYSWKGKTVNMTEDALEELFNNNIIFSTTHNVPVFIDQIGIRSGVPNSFQWAQDGFDLAINAGFGFSWWDFRNPYRSQTYQGPLDLCIYWQDANTNWNGPKDGNTNSIANGGDGNNWIAMIQSKFAGTVGSDTPPLPPLPTIPLNVNAINYDFKVSNSHDYSKTWNILYGMASDSGFLLTIKSSANVNAQILLVAGIAQDKTVSGIVLADDYLTSGNFDITLLASDLVNLTPGVYYYDFQMINIGGYAETYVYGTVTVKDGL